MKMFIVLIAIIAIAFADEFSGSDTTAEIVSRDIGGDAEGAAISNVISPVR